MSNNKQAYIDFIIDELNKGNVKYNDVCMVFCGKFGLTENTFIKYWKQANDKHSEHRQAIEAAKMEQSIEIEKEVVKSQIKSKEQLLIKLNEIIEQKAKRVEGMVIMPTFSDVLKAVDIYNKMMGWNAVIKTDITTNNEPIKSQPQIFDLNELLEAVKKK
jgi:hypothetical protein